MFKRLQSIHLPMNPPKKSTSHSIAQERLSHLSHSLSSVARTPSETVPVQAGMATIWDPDQDSFPTLDQLPAIPGAPKDAAWFWGENDNVGFSVLLKFGSRYLSSIE